MQYRHLETGEIVQAGDEIDRCRDPWRDDPLWEPVHPDNYGEPAPDPKYPSHRQYRRPLEQRVEHPAYAVERIVEEDGDILDELYVVVCMHTGKHMAVFLEEQSAHQHIAILESEANKRRALILKNCDKCGKSFFSAQRRICFICKPISGPSREWLERMAKVEDECQSVSVGGMASDLGLAAICDLPKNAKASVLQSMISALKAVQNYGSRGETSDGTSVSCLVDEAISLAESTETADRPAWIDEAAKACAEKVLVGAGADAFANIIERHFKRV